jgi:hypothetical protein
MHSYKKTSNISKGSHNSKGGTDLKTLNKSE